MYIDKYNIENWGSTWSKGKEKKNQLIGSIKGNDIDIKKLVHLLQEYNEAVNGEYATRDIDITISMRERSWVMDQQERAMEEAADRLKEEEGLKTFKVTERYIKEDTWIVNAINKEEATDIAMSVDPDSSEVVEVTSTTAEPLRDHIKKILEES